MDEFEEARALAMKLGAPAAAVGAINGKVKLFGLEAPTRSKHEHTSPDGSMTPQPAIKLTNLSDEELAQLERLTDKARDQEGVGEEE